MWCRGGANVFGEVECRCSVVETVAGVGCHIGLLLSN